RLTYARQLTYVIFDLAFPLLLCALVCPLLGSCYLLFFFLIDTATSEIYSLSLHDALPILAVGELAGQAGDVQRALAAGHLPSLRSEEHTSELQSRENLVCRLLLEKKNTENNMGNRRTAGVTGTEATSMAQGTSILSGRWIW